MKNIHELYTRIIKAATDDPTIIEERWFRDILITARENATEEEKVWLAEKEAILTKDILLTRLCVGLMQDKEERNKAFRISPDDGITRSKTIRAMEKELLRAERDKFSTLIKENIAKERHNELTNR